METKMPDPVATYRIQFHKGFTFSDLEQIIPYLQHLGVKTIYASPIFEAVPGSMHGYDIINPHRINPEIGSLQQLRDISQRLKSAGIIWLQDIVPNHMAFHWRNEWLMEVLEKGGDSFYAEFFDIDWAHPDFEGKLMLPVLNTALPDAIRKKELYLVYSGDKLMLQYADNQYPVSQGTYSFPESEQLDKINNDDALLQTVIQQQHYLPCCWRETEKRINYRRFFTINGLICLNMQNERAFSHYHEFIKQLIEEDIFQGLRVDHVDGLYDPTEYLFRLRSLAGDDIYIVVEKILQRDEKLPEYWPVQGTTGYDFLADVNNLLTWPKDKNRFTTYFERVTENYATPSQLLENKKAIILYNHMQGELENLLRLFKELRLAVLDNSAIPDSEFREAIGEFLICCPVYRYYGGRFPLDEREASAVQNIFDDVKDRKPELRTAINALIEILLVAPLDNNQEYNERALQFYKRCMQYTGPLMAKGLEDTFMYTYNRFIAHNDVGVSPLVFGISVKSFHKKMQERQLHSPRTLNATATHDTKRGEDVRARLNVISEMAEGWMNTVTLWNNLNSNYKQGGAPDANDEYFIYQSLAGCYPMPEEDDGDFRDRFCQYTQKALREAKTHTNWTKTNDQYEQSVTAFINQLLNKETPFYASLSQFVERIADAGIMNSLVQVVLKFTCPGIPDIYRGCELWSLSMVDPDNRRAVNFEKRMTWQQEMEQEDEGTEHINDLWLNRFNGQIKLWLTGKLLRERKLNNVLFTDGHYIPLRVAGKYKKHILAFARQYQFTWYVVAVPLHLSVLTDRQQKYITDLDWDDTSIKLPGNMPDHYVHLTDNSKRDAKNEIKVSDIFVTIPIAILKFERVPNKRGAGILMPVFSLPSKFGIGDFGPAAKDFADFLYRTNQKYWQLLPINPIEEKDCWSPYNSISGMAGNAILVSPELLAEDGLLHADDLEKYQTDGIDNIDYKAAAGIKNKLLELAYRNFTGGDFVMLRHQYEKFCRKEARWLDNYALYVALKDHFDGRFWFDWPDEYKMRNASALEKFREEHLEQLKEVKWRQFIFFRQWSNIKAYCNRLGIKLIGDLPFYVSYDSLAVWIHPEFFCLDEEGNISGIAGVPPDYFTEDGQLWNMPTYNWSALKKINYDWWVNRLRHNLRLFDIIRLDHFRAFEAYWEIPQGSPTAKNGKWIKGAGIDFFNVLHQELGHLPFIAEDLGDVMEDVYRLRERTGLPGMKVLQFAWGKNMPVSVDIPHNYPLNCVAYTGTHDNNTTAGWYREETKKEDHKRMREYLGIKVNKKNIPEVFARTIYASVAQTVILPIQDVIGADEHSRINLPGTDKHNWQWRLPEDAISRKMERQLLRWVHRYNRE